MTEISSDPKAVVKLLELVRGRPQMFIGKGLPEVVNFLLGFNTACRMLGLELPDETIFSSVLVEHGWETTTLATLNAMREDGMDDSAITEELLTCHIEAWQLEYSIQQQEG